MNMPQRGWRSAAILIVACLLQAAGSLPAKAKPRTLTVAMGESVQAAVLMARPGDTVLVSGMHNEPITLKSGLTLRGLNTSAVVMWAEGPAITVKDATRVRIEGLRVVAATPKAAAQGGIAIVNAQVSISGCDISGAADGVIARGRSEVAIADSRIAYCGDSGVRLLGQTTGALLNNQIMNNQLHGIAVGEEARPSIAHNVLRENAHAGIGYFGRSRGESRSNLLTGNGRCGVLVEQQAGPSLIHNTVLRHDGPGILLNSREAVNIGFNVIAWNAPGLKAAAGAQAIGVRDNLVAENRGGDYEGLRPASAAAPRTIRFTDDQGFRLATRDGGPDEDLGWQGRQAAGTTVTAEGPPSLPPALTAAVTLEEPSGNGVLDGGEEARLKLVVKNGGKGPATRVRATLAASPANPAMRYPALVEVGSLGAGEQKEVNVTVRGLPGLAKGQAQLAVQLTDAFGFDAPPVRLLVATGPFSPPVLSVRQVGSDDANGNGLLERGEQIDVKVVVTNSGAGLAKGVRARFVSTDPRIKALGEEVADLGDMAPGRWKEARFSFLVPNRYDGAPQLPISVSLSEADPRFTVSHALPMALDQAAPRVVEAALEAQAPTASAPEPAYDVDVDKPVATALSNPQAFAVVIGIERYNPAVPAVRFARRDATIFKAYLTRTLGVPEANVIFLTDERATFGHMRTALEGQLPRWVEKGRSDVYVYFAGHGAPEMGPNTPFLVPYDGDPAYPATSCYPLASVYQALARLQARSVTVCLDSCFSGQSGRETTPLPLLADARLLTIAPKLDAVPAGLTVFAAAHSNQLSAGFARMKHGLFTYYWLKGLQGHADADGDKRVSVGELQRYLLPRVAEEARRMNRDQTPMLLGDGDGRILVTLP